MAGAHAAPIGGNLATWTWIAPRAVVRASNDPSTFQATWYTMLSSAGDIIERVS